MRIYLLEPNLSRQYRGLIWANKADEPIFLDAWSRFVPSPLPLTPDRVPRLQSNWKPLHVAEVPMDLPPSDYPSFGSRPAFSGKALEVLRNLLEPNGEILDLICDTGKYFAFNPTVLVSALDRKRSHIDWFDPRTQTLARRVLKYEFVSSLVEHLTIFRLPECPLSWFVTEIFYNQALNGGLNGMVFKQIWPNPSRSEIEAKWIARRHRKR